MNKTPKPPRGYHNAPAGHKCAIGDQITCHRDGMSGWIGVNSDCNCIGMTKAEWEHKHRELGWIVWIATNQSVSSITLKRGRCGCWPYLAGSKRGGYGFFCVHYDWTKVDLSKTVPLAADAWNKERGGK